MHNTHDLEGWCERVTSLSDLSSWRDALQMTADGDLTVCYAPFDYVNPEARVIIVGITPGEAQAINALESLRQAFGRGQSTECALRAAKQYASFSGAMRDNLVRLLNHIGLHNQLGVPSSAKLFEPDNTLAHFTSVLRYPVFLRGNNYSGTPAPMTQAMLSDQVQRYFVEELAILQDAWILPLGSVPEAVMTYYVKTGVIDGQRVLRGLPHPSPANNERILYFLGMKPADQLSLKTNSAKLDAAKTRLRAQIDGEYEPTNTEQETSLSPVTVPSIPGAPSSSRAVAASIYAVGKHDVFVPYQDKDGMYILYSKCLRRKTGDPIHHKSNRELVSSLAEAERLLRAGTHHIRLRGRSTRRCNVFCPESVKFGT